MTAPFMRAYTDCSSPLPQRGALPWEAWPPSFQPAQPRGDAQALARVREDKERESLMASTARGFAHTDRVPVALEAFDAVLASGP